MPWIYRKCSMIGNSFCDVAATLPQITVSITRVSKDFCTVRMSCRKLGCRCGISKRRFLIICGRICTGMSKFKERLGKLSPKKRLYALETLPRHLAESVQGERLHHLLTDFDFIEAKLDAL